MHKTYMPLSLYSLMCAVFLLIYFKRILNHFLSIKHASNRGGHERRKITTADWKDSIIFNFFSFLHLFIFFSADAPYLSLVSHVQLLCSLFSFQWLDFFMLALVQKWNIYVFFFKKMGDYICAEFCKFFKMLICWIFIDFNGFLG